MTKSIASLKKGIDILRCFDFGNQTISAQAISGRLAIPLSTTYRYLETLTEKGFLEREPGSKNYELGFMLFRLGNIMASRMKLTEILLPHMKHLSALSEETVLLTTIRGWEVVCIDRVETRRLIKLSLDRGSTLPLHAGASSKILLAYQKDSFIDSMLENNVLTKFTKTTITDPVRLRRELRMIQKQGFAFSDQEVDLGAIAIGAPVFDHTGKIAAGLTVAGPRERIKGRERDRLIKLVKEVGKNASNDLGYKDFK